MKLSSNQRLVLKSILWALGGMMVCNIIGSFYIELHIVPGTEPTPDVIHNGIMMAFISYMVIMASLMVFMTWQRGISSQLSRNLFNLTPVFIFVATPPLHWRLSILLLTIILATAIYQALVIRQRRQDLVFKEKGGG